jgi:ATP/maltotriose-dependent transcriptional regulator MalT
MPAADAPMVLRGRVMAALALLSLLQGDLNGVAELAESALAIDGEQPDTALRALATACHGGVALFRGELSRAEALFLETLPLAREARLRVLETQMLENLSQVALARGDLVNAEARIADELASARLSGNVWSLAMALNSQGELLRARAQYQAAGAAYEEALAIFRSLNARGRAPPGMVHNLGYVSLGSGNPRLAAEQFLESADLYRAMGADRRGLAECVMGLGGAAVRGGRPEQGARLLGAAEAALETLETSFTPTNRADYERTVTALREMLAADQLVVHWAAGRALSLDEALAEARFELDGLPRVVGPPGRSRSGELTTREHEVARLLASGLSNRQIAAELVISERTAANHVQRVMDKMGVHSRAQLAARSADFGLTTT